MHKMPGLEVKVMNTKAVVIRVVVIVMVMVVDGLMLRMPRNSRGFQLISLKGINQSYLVIMSIGLINFSQNTEFKNCSLQSIAYHSIIE